MNNISKASHAELCDQALKHYHEISTSAFHFNSLIVKAIEFYKEVGPAVREQSESAVQAERTRIIKALEGLKEDEPYDFAMKAFNNALDQAIKAVEEKE